MNLKNYYFTFGSHEMFPYKNTYLIVKADNRTVAIEKFREKYPDKNNNCVNCAFIYDEEEWEKSLNKTTYGEPAEIID